MGHLTFKVAGWMNWQKPVYDVYNKEGFQCGDISWDKDWKCWTYDQAYNGHDSADCLMEIVRFIKAPNKHQLVKS